MFTFLGKLSLQSVEIKRMSSKEIITRYGKYRGVIVEIHNHQNLRNIEGYLGVSYGVLRTRSAFLRFQSPGALTRRWISIRDKSNFEAVCPQTVNITQLRGPLPSKIVARMSIANIAKRQIEECLTINLYVPIQGKKPRHLSRLSTFYSRGIIFRVNSREYRDAKIKSSPIR